MGYFEILRKNLVNEMVSNSAIKSKSVEKAFLETRRELFFPEEQRKFAYADNAFSIGFGQTISQPSTIAIMLELLDAKKGMNVLEIGSGSGYVLALLSKIAGEKGKVYGIELIEGLAAISKKNIQLQECKNIEIFIGNGTEGLKEKGPFDRIIISATAGEIPEEPIKQLKDGGKIVCPVESVFSHKIVAIRKEKNKKIIEKEIEGFVFVPLIFPKKKTMQ